MEGVPVPRWAIGFVAMRWRHVFWILPLAGMLAGLGLQLWNLYGPTVTGVIQVCPIPVSSAHTMLKDADHAPRSDEVVSKIVAWLDLAKQWGVDPDTCVSKLQKMTRTRQIPGTSLIEVWVSGSNRDESIKVWNALAHCLNEYFADKRNAAHEEKLAKIKSAVETLERDVEEKRRKLSAALGNPELLLLAPNLLTDGDNIAEAPQLKAAFEAAQRTLEKEKTNLFNAEVSRGGMAEPIYVLEPPAPSPPLIHPEALRALFPHAGIGLSIGVVVTIPLAYLLELLFPRKSRGLPGGT